MTAFYVYASSGYSTREQLARGRFLKGIQNYMENTNEGNENKIILGDFNCIVDKKDRYGGNKSGKVKHELRVQIHELRVQIHELRVQIHEL